MFVIRVPLKDAEHPCLIVSFGLFLNFRAFCSPYLYKDLVQT